MSAPAEAPAVPSFPSREYFAALAGLMNANRARQKQLGYIDCVAVFSVTDGDAARHFRVTFEEFSAIAVDEVTAEEAAAADFALRGSLATWPTMLELIATGAGRPALEQTLNYLSHLGTPLKLVAAAPLKADLYCRYKQSLQECFNASCALATRFDA